MALSFSTFMACIFFLMASIVTDNLCLAAQPVQETLVWNETILVFLVSELVKEFTNVLLGDLIAQHDQEVLELGQHHGAVLVLVVELAQLDVVVVVASVLWLLDGLLDEADNLIKLAELLAGVVGLAVLDADLLDDVHAKGVEDIHEVVHVKDAFAIPIVDLADLLDIISASHGDECELYDLSLKRL